MLYMLLFEILVSAINVFYMLHKGFQTSFKKEILSPFEGHIITCTPGTIAFDFKCQNKNQKHNMKRVHFVHELEM